MKKALLLLLGIVAVCFLIANVDYLAQFLDTLKPRAARCRRHHARPGYTDEALEILKTKKGGKYNVVRIDPAYVPAETELKDERIARGPTPASPPAEPSSRRSATSPPCWSSPSSAF